MKRNNQTVRSGRRTRSNGKSKYAAKRASGNMMYGPGCCGHSYAITAEDRRKWAEQRRRNEQHDFRHVTSQEVEAFYDTFSRPEGTVLNPIKAIS
jgi:hypothetical protein